LRKGKTMSQTASQPAPSSPRYSITEASVDKVVAKLEASLAEVVAARGSQVRLPKAELNLLAQVEFIRDAIANFVGESNREAGRSALERVFGGGSDRLMRIRTVMDTLQLSEGNARDQRPTACLRACESVDRLIGERGMATFSARNNSSNNQLRVKTRRTCFSEESSPMNRWGSECPRRSSSSSSCQVSGTSLAARLRAVVSPTSASAGKNSCMFEARESEDEGDEEDETGEDHEVSDVPLLPGELSADGTEDVCLKHVVAATLAEAEAVSLDRCGNFKRALRKYSECKQKLSVAIAATLDNHVEDQPKLVQHCRAISTRIKHLKAALQNESAPGPVEEDIHPVELGTFQVFALRDDDGNSTDLEPLEAFALPLHQNLETQLSWSLRDSAEGVRAAIESAAVGAGNLTTTVAGSLAGGFIVLGGAARASANAANAFASEVAGTARPEAASAVVNGAALQAGRFASKVAESASEVTGTLATETQRFATKISNTEVTDAIAKETQRMASRLADVGSTAAEGTVEVTSSIRRTLKGARSQGKHMTDVVSAAITEAPGQLSRLTRSWSKSPPRPAQKSPSRPAQKSPSRPAQQPGCASVATAPRTRSASWTAGYGTEALINERPQRGSAWRRSLTHPPCKRATPSGVIDGI